MTTYLHFGTYAAATLRNQGIAQGLGCGPITLSWFNQLAHADGRQALEVVDVAHEAILTPTERTILTPSLWYQNALSGTIYVATQGSQIGSGSIDNPVNLGTVCSALCLIAPGSTIVIQAGEYVGDFVFTHAGTALERITIAFRDEAIVKGSFTVGGNYLDVVSLDVYDAPAGRFTEEIGSAPSFMRHEGLSIFGHHVNIVHPRVMNILGNGVGFWQTSIDSVLYGMWVLNNGWLAPDRGHGHAPYTQNEASGSKLLRNLMLAPQYGGALRVYTTNQNLERVTVDRCICISDQLFLGGHSPASQCVITNNTVWNADLEIGETDRGNVDVLIDGNYVASSLNTRCFVYRFWGRLTVTNNTFVMRQDNSVGLLGEYLRLSPSVENINHNIYYYQQRADGKYFTLYDYAVEPPSVTYLTIAQWQALGYDTNSTFIEGLPASNRVFVEHSEYDNDIAHVAIYNWENLGSVPVDFSGGNLTLTNTYHAYNAMNPGEHHSFTYDGEPVPIPMTGWTRAIPAGDTEPLTSDPWPLFGAFVVKPAP